MGRPRSFDERAVLAAARAEFRARGYAATSLDHILAATGLGKGSLYGAFGDKHQLFLAVLADYSAGRVAEMRASMCGERPAIELLRGFLHGSPSEPGSDPACRGCLLVNSTFELAPQDAEVVKQSREAFGAVEDLLAEIAERARDEGDLAPDTDPRALARLLLAVMHGQEFLAKTGMDAEALAQIGRTAAEKLLAARPAEKLPAAPPAEKLPAAPPARHRKGAPARRR